MIYYDYYRTHHEQSDLFIYCGHGAGEDMGESAKIAMFESCPASLLWGCSSGRLRSLGVHDATGPALNYLLAGAPFVLGCLWSVTALDIDKLSMDCMAASIPKADSAHGDCHRITSALAKSRSVCKYAHAVGSAPVVYGLPIRIV